MGFVKEAFPLGGIGLAAKALDKKKKPAPVQPMMTLTNRPTERSTSMIGNTRGLY